MLNLHSKRLDGKSNVRKLWDIMEKKGYFITFEGGEACGKSTQLAMLEKHVALLNTGRRWIFTRSPGGTLIAEKIRGILKSRNETEDILPSSELLLFGACHAQMTQYMIRPAILEGSVIVSDRFYDSTTVYQGYARGLDLGFVQSINRFSCGGLRPDLTILLDIDVKSAMRRVLERGGHTQTEDDRFDSESESFHESIRAGFLALAGYEPKRFRVIDASADTETVHKKILEAIREQLGIL